MPRVTITPEKYINPDVLAMRIDMAEKMEREERVKEQKQKATGLSQKDTDLIHRISAVSETDSLVIRRQEELREMLEEEHEQLKAELEEREEYNENLREELGAFI